MYKDRTVRLGIDLSKEQKINKLHEVVKVKISSIWALSVKIKQHIQNSYFNEVCIYPTLLYRAFCNVKKVILDNILFLSKSDESLFKKLGDLKSSCLKTVSLYRKDSVTNIPIEQKKRILTIGAYLAPMKFTFWEKEIKIHYYGLGEVEKEEEYSINVALRVSDDLYMHHLKLLLAKDQATFLMTTKIGQILRSSKFSRKYLATLCYKHDKSKEAFKIYISYDPGFKGYFQRL